MSNDMPQPGDTVKITKPGRFENQEFVVAERPENSDSCNFDDIYVVYNGKAVRVPSGSRWYVTVKRARSSTRGEDVDVFLNKQRDANLNSIFG